MSDKSDANVKDVTIVWGEGNPPKPLKMIPVEASNYAVLGEVIPTMYFSAANCDDNLLAFEGFLHDYSFLYQIRDGYAKLTVADSFADLHANENLFYCASEYIGKRPEPVQWIELLLNLVENLEVAPYLYKFEFKPPVVFGFFKSKVRAFDPSRDKPLPARYIAGAWAFSKESALEEITRFTDRDVFRQHGISVEKQRMLHEATMETLSDEPISLDERKFTMALSEVAVTNVPDEFRAPTGRIILSNVDL